VVNFLKPLIDTSPNDELVAMVCFEDRAAAPAKPIDANFIKAKPSHPRVRTCILPPMQDSPNPLIFLASASPRRSALLTQIGVPHRVRATNLDESRRNAEHPSSYVQRLAREKAHAVWSVLPVAERLPVLAADTTVAIDADILGKPADEEDAVRMLSRLSGRSHQVYTGLALISGDGTREAISVSEVQFRKLQAAEIRTYWHTGEPADKAGAYAVQGLAAAFIERIAGSYSGIMGLPLFETAELLSHVGWSIASQHATLAETRR
jgi:septum formation protein